MDLLSLVECQHDFLDPCYNLDMDDSYVPQNHFWTASFRLLLVHNYVDQCLLFLRHFDSYRAFNGATAFYRDSKTTPSHYRRFLRGVFEFGKFFCVFGFCLHKFLSGWTPSSTRIFPRHTNLSEANLFSNWISVRQSLVNV